MLTDEEKREIATLVASSHDARSVTLEALQVAQHRRGWIDDETLRAVAAELSLAPAGLEAVATGYSLIYRRPVGRHVILLCDSVSCWIVGYDAVREHLHARLGIGLGETTADGRFTLLPVACLGACDRAPVMMIDGDLHGELTPEKIDEILKKYE